MEQYFPKRKPRAGQGGASKKAKPDIVAPIPRPVPEAAPITASISSMEMLQRGTDALVAAEPRELLDVSPLDGVGAWASMPALRACCSHPPA